MTENTKVAMPAVIYAKIHGGRTQHPSGQFGLIGGWGEHPADGHEPMVPKAQVDVLRAALADVAGILDFICKTGRPLVRETTRFVITGGGDAPRALTLKAALDKADAALEQSGGAL